jgi:hypothetical protein
MLITLLNKTNYNEKLTLDTWSKRTQTNPIKPNLVRLRRVQKGQAAGVKQVGGGGDKKFTARIAEVR